MKWKFCPECGTQVFDKPWKYCAECGNNLQQSDQAHPFITPQYPGIYPSYPIYPIFPQPYTVTWTAGDDLAHGAFTCGPITGTISTH